MKMKRCPNCGGKLYEDAAEYLYEKEDGSIVLGGYLAYVCGNECGFVERLDKRPNIFSFGTTELTQDAFLCWLFEHLKLKFEDIPAKIAQDLLQKIKREFADLHSEIPLEKLQTYKIVDIEQQAQRVIDILLTLESEYYPEQLLIFIEDKIHSGESRKDQVLVYKEKLKKLHPDAIIIPVLFKSGYTSEQQKQKERERNIVLISYEEIYGVFSKYESELREDAILTSWWDHFLESSYWPIRRAQLFEVDENLTLQEINQIFKEEKHPEKIFFQKVSEYLFGDLRGFFTQIFKVQGSGHIDWHYQIRKSEWKMHKRNFEFNLYFLWDTRRFSLVIKTAPIPYRRRRNLSEAERERYFAQKREAVNHFKKSGIPHWKFTNGRYLQIAQMKEMQDVPVGELKKLLLERIPVIAAEIDRLV